MCGHPPTHRVPGARPRPGFSDVQCIDRERKSVSKIGIFCIFSSFFLVRALAELRPTADWRHHRCVKILEITFLKNTTPQATHHGPGPRGGFSTKPKSPERPDSALGPDNLLQGLVCSIQVGREHDGLLRQRCRGGEQASGGVCVLAHCGETLAALSCNVHQVLETISASFRSATEDCGGVTVALTSDPPSSSAGWQPGSWVRPGTTSRCALDQSSISKMPLTECLGG